MVKCVLPQRLRCGPPSAGRGDLTHCRGGSQPLGPEFPQVVWVPWQNGGGSVLSFLLQPYSSPIYSGNVSGEPAAYQAQTGHCGYSSDMGQGCCLLVVAFSGRDQDPIANPRCGRAAVWCEVLLLCMRVCVLPGCQPPPGGTDPGAAFPRKWSCSRTFLTSCLIPCRLCLLAGCAQRGLVSTAV